MRIENLPSGGDERIDDRRGFRIGRGGAIGGGAAVVALVLALLGAPQEVVRSVLEGGGGAVTTTENAPIDPAQEPLAREAKAVFVSTDETWTALFSQKGQRYQGPDKLVLFSEAVESTCGVAGSAVGPFYCPPDRRVYLDLGFFQELEQRFGAPGDFAQAYVIAHEVGHHVQNLTGISDKVQAARQRASEVEGNQLSVRLELQADCLAGVWAHHADRARKFLEAGDVEEALRAASAIGDDTLQKRARGQVVPESFTHGTSAQRVHWFKTGMQTGDFQACDTFKGEPG
jgi:predicted metalloprotease